MPRLKLIAGNWKMYPADAQGALDLLRPLRSRLAAFTKTQVVIVPPFTALHLAVGVLKDSRAKLGAQNLHWENTGAFTGEVSAPMLKAAGCDYVIIGHSERREKFGESNENVHKKIQAALKHELTPIVCVGETLPQREAGVQQEIVREQVTEALRGMAEASLAQVVLAYEPVWAIGTGRTATPAQVQEMHQFIRALLADTFSTAVADRMLLLYGGSVKPDNARDLLSQPDVDGALVGGASLNADAFAQIVQSAETPI